MQLRERTGVRDVAAFLAEHAGDDVCRLVTTGRRSGGRHDIEIWFGVAGEQLAFIAGNGPTCDWYRNALADPAVEVRLGGAWLAGVARDALGDDRRLVGEVMGAKHGGWGGDPSIDLTMSAWLWDVPALVVSELQFSPSATSP